MKAKSQKKSPLSCKLRGDKVVIEIGIDTLAFAFEESEYNNPFDVTQNKHVRTDTIAFKKEFARDVVNEINDEEEDGSTLLTGLFDKATERAVENGSLGIREI